MIDYHYVLVPEKGDRIRSLLDYQRKDVAVRLGQTFAEVHSRNTNMDVELQVLVRQKTPNLSFERVVHVETISFIRMEA